MADNVHKYGFKWVGSVDGSCYPKPLELTVASGYQAQVSAADVDLNIGDPVQMSTDGTVVLASGGGSPGTLFGVIVGIANAKVDAEGRARPSARLPGGTTWATEATRSKVLVVPFGRGIWEIDCDDKTTATTLTDYRALINENCDLTYNRDASNADRPKANPMLDISTHVTSTANFRIFDVSKTMENQDFSGLYVKVRVVVNESQEAPFVTAGS